MAKKKKLKVLGVLTFKKYVVLEVDDPQEPETDGSRQPNWEARSAIARLAEEKAKDVEYEWTFSDYYKEATKEDEADGTQEVDGIRFSDEEWFDL